MNVKIVVGDEEILLGKRKSCGLCPVTRAFRKVVKPDYDIEVDGIVILIENGSGQTRSIVPLPNKARVWILIFDHFGRRNVSPFEFEIQISDEFLLAASDGGPS